jgi:hypothetical protein
MGVPGEANWPVPPLSVPDADSSPTDLMRYEAVRLFVERARLRLPSFDLTPANAQAVAEVCRRLDGNPLAIELVTALAIQQVAERIEDSLSLLISGPRAATPRHQTMRATIEWSSALLSEPEQAEPELKGPRQKKWLEWLEREHDNMQVALGWVLERKVETPESIELGARLASAPWRFWYKRGHLSTGHRWLDATLSKSGMLSTVTRVKALGGAGLVAWERGDYASARAIHEEGLRLHRQAENKPGIAFSLNHLGLVALYQGNFRSAKGLLEEGLILQQELEDAGGKAAALHRSIPLPRWPT